jgi:hypothetical protein
MAPRPSKQSGFLLEIPLLMMLAGVLMAVLLPHLPAVPGKILVGVGAMAFTAGCYYLLIIPGWRPDAASRPRRPWNWIVFLALAAAIGLAAVGYITAR